MLIDVVLFKVSFQPLHKRFDTSALSSVNNSVNGNSVNGQTMIDTSNTLASSVENNMWLVEVICHITLTGQLVAAVST